MKRWLERRWYGSEPPPALLQGLATLYGRIASRRRQRLEAARGTLPVPVIVVGNITAGGTGKTPFVIWLVDELRSRGYRPGVISRGYGGHADHYPLRVRTDTAASACGDEPLLIALRTAAPVMVAPDRLAAARALIDSGEVDLLVADDGLQHYRLPRDLELCIVDGARGLGNGALIPAGPLREPPSRLREVDRVIVNGPGYDAGPQAARFDLESGDAYALADPTLRLPLASFAGRTVHAVAGIGNPERFFSGLEARGLQLHRHAFPDHHAYTATDLQFGDGLPTLMTEKDAVKCRGLAGQAWVVPVSARLSPDDQARVRESLQCIDKRL